MQANKSVQVSTYHAPELYNLGNIDQVQRFWFGWFRDWAWWRCTRFCWS